MQEKIRVTQRRLFSAAAEMDTAASALYAADPHSAAATEMITGFGVRVGGELVVEWRAFWMYLFARFRDGVTLMQPRLPVCADGERRQCTVRHLLH